MDDLSRLMQKYEAATNSHDFDRVAPLVEEGAVYWFSDGSYAGLADIRKAFETVWKTVKTKFTQLAMCVGWQRPIARQFAFTIFPGKAQSTASQDRAEDGALMFF